MEDFFRKMEGVMKAGKITWILHQRGEAEVQI